MNFFGESRLILALAAFGEQHDREALKWLSLIVKSVFGRPFDSIYRANNDLQAYQDDPELLRSTNSCSDFSAWDACITKYFESDFRPTDILVFANDSFHRNFGTGILRYFLSLQKQDLDSNMQSAIIGVVDDFPKPVEVLGHRGDQWVRSNFFFMTSTNLSRLKPLSVGLDLCEKIFDQNPRGRFFLPDAPLSENYKAYMNCWLFADKNPRFPEYNITWKNAEPLSEGNKTEFQRKMRAILSEHTMSFKAQSLGIKLANVNPQPWDSLRHTVNIYERHEALYEPLGLGDVE
jgi:hypothetical protein